MAKTFFDNPPAQNGRPEEYLQALYGYLFTMSSKLNEALMDVSIEQMTPETQTVIKQAGKAEAKSEETYKQLKEIIVKNAEIARMAMDEISTELTRQYTAISEEFGTYQQTLDAQISATAAGIMQQYNMEERMQAVEDDTAAFINGMNAYIFSGLLSDDPPTYGIAIGYNVTNEDGTLNNQNKSATFTADKLSFWLNGAEVAYFSNSVFHIASGEITDQLRMGGYIWKTLAGGAMALMKG